MNINFCIICMYDGKCVHLVGYENRPTMNDVKGLVLELLNDEEFGLKDIVGNLDIKLGEWSDVLYMRQCQQNLQ